MTLIKPPTPAGISAAAELLRSGEIVAIPTETVYGLAANALDPAAIEKVFAAKGRPRDNPLIVHVSDLGMARGLELEIPELAEKLAENFWAEGSPFQGPLTMVLKRKTAPPQSGIIPTEVSCGLNTVAVRVPAHPAALAIIKACGFPLAAPSANISGSPSPTKAKHVYADLNGRIPLIIDGGDCDCGVESTVVMFDDGKIKILRPGAVTMEMLSEFGDVVIDDECSLRSPGTRHKHYSPKAEVIAVIAENKEVFSKYIGKTEFVIANPEAQTFFSKLREFDELGAERIFIRLPEPVGIGLALYNRIVRAAEFKIVKAENDKSK
ncbi:MAG: threonylcarbamoyl-AMP synthase [Oscillospiraceae bacterium]|jgi:L-threonylcarbamoyladenylate synthase|nr:threonylcarbamoyl-AMP synthase [Oscillospiraceae bacterium]